MAKRIQGKYVCLGCGKLFDEEDIKVVEESRGEFWGFPCTERMYYSPCCTDDYDDAYEENEDDELMEE